MNKIFSLSLICFALFFHKIIFAQQLTLDNIMQGNEFVGNLPEESLFSEDGTQICFLWNKENRASAQWYSFKIENGKISGEAKKMSAQEILDFVPEEGNYSKDFTKKVFSKNGDLFLWEKNKKLRQITATNAYESNPIFVKNETSIAFEQNNNLFLFDLQTGLTAQITDFKTGKDKKSAFSDEDKYLRNQQKELFEIIKSKEQKSAERKKMQEALQIKKLKTIFTDNFNTSFITLSPDAQNVAFGLADEGDGKPTEVHHFVTASGFTEQKPARDKVGYEKGEYSFGLFSIKKDTVFYPNFTDLEGIFDNPTYYAEYGRDLKAKEARKIIVNAAFFSPDSKFCVLLIRALDSKDRWVAAVNLENGELKTLDRQRDEAWIGGPGVENWLQAVGTSGWIDKQHFYFQSEKTGFSHLYKVNVENGKIEQLSKGNFEIVDVKMSRTEKFWYLTANKEHAGDYQLYKMPISGGDLEKITSKEGMHEAVAISPDEKFLTFRYSTSTKPWEIYFAENKANAPYQQLTFSLTEKFKAQKWLTPEVIAFPASDGVSVHARVYKGANADGRAVIFVHGAGYLQNAHKGWSNYFREFMFHQFLVEKGYTVLDIDYRGSKGYGRDFRTGIYRFMGGKDLSDHVDGAKYLTEKYGVNPQKIGIYGGSYGGFITLMAMFQHGDVFKAGAALRSVTDWAHYNHQYTSNILNTPNLDSLAYRRSSPIYFAEGLKGNLLICHGLVDDNVQPQDVVRLSQRLIELRKENWEFAVYPIEAHGFVEGTSWADEYKRIFKLFENSLK